ncbi:MAG TPA: zinc ribbon domain-containing protein [Armatimonadota bacterium]|nr:zinc ribbon domain-containing protein [Armatimonadota bacterium]
MSSLFGKFKEGMDQVVTGAQDKLHETQLRGQLKVIEREKADQVTALGTALYAMHQAGNIVLESLQGQFQAIDEVEQRLVEKQREIDEFVASSADASPGASQSGSQTGVPNRHCACGAVLSPAARFCPECGKPNPVEPV